MKALVAFFILIFFTLLIGCKTNSLLPQTQNVPLFTEKNQLQANATFSYRTVELQAAYSPVNHLGIIANGMLGPGPMNSVEAGIGGYMSPDQRAVVELYGGYGAGSALISDTVHGSAVYLGKGDHYYNVSMQAHKIFIQPNIGIRFNDKVQLGLSIKTSFWSFPKYEYYSERYSTSGNLKHVDSISVRNGDQITFEPAITLKAGGKSAKFMVQGGCYILNDVSRGRVNPFNDVPLFIRMGMTIEFGKSKE